MKSMISKPIDKIWVIVEGTDYRPKPRVMGVRSTETGADDLKQHMVSAGIEDWRLKVHEIDLGSLDEEPVICWEISAGSSFWDEGRTRSVSLKPAVAYGRVGYPEPEWSEEGFCTFYFPRNNENPEHEGRDGVLSAAAAYWDQRLRPEWERRRAAWKKLHQQEAAGKQPAKELELLKADLTAHNTANLRTYSFDARGFDGEIYSSVAVEDGDHTQAADD